MKLVERDNTANIKRLNEIIKVVGQYGFGYILEKIRLKTRIPLIQKSYEYDSLEELDESLPLRLRMVLQELGPTFIKLGQTLSTRPDLVGDDIAHEFSKMQDDNPPLPFHEIKIVIEEELNAPLETLFKDFKEEPLGSASIGQVHEAVLHDGKKVAIKVQKPNTEYIIKKDIDIMRFFARRIDEYVPQSKNYNLPGIVDEFERSILKEIDYEQEARNINHFNEIFKTDQTIYVPLVYEEYCTTKVLTMELIEGTKISDVITSDKSFNRKIIAKRGVESYFKQIMTYGFFHADPHPANIYVMEDNIICFLDYGMMGILTKEFREDLAELFIYFIEYNIKGMINQLSYMEIIDEGIDQKALQYDLTDLMYRYYGTELKEIHGGINDMVKLMTKYHVSLPREFVLLGRGIAMLEDSGKKLDPKFNAVEILKPMATKIIRKKMSPLKLVDFIKNNIFEVEHLLKTLPHSLNKTLYKLEEGNFTLEIEHKDLERISNKISIALILAALLIGSSLIMQTNKGILFLDYPFLGILGFMISAIIGFGLVISILKHD